MSEFDVTKISMTDVGNKMFIIPQDPETREDLLAIDRQTKAILTLKHRSHIRNDWEANTIANVVIEKLCQILYSHIIQNGVSILDEDDNAINFYDLVEISASNKKNMSAEKTGNVNIKFIAGSKVADIISDNTPSENKEYQVIDIIAAYSFPDDIDRNEAMKKLDKIAREELAKKYSILLPKDFQAIAVAVIMLENIYRRLVEKIVLNGKTSTMLNFNDIIEFHANKIGDKIDMKLRPGMGAKLIIKTDEGTEGEDGFDD